MIRLIVSDLDGTLLNKKKQYSARLPQLLAELEKRGIVFAAASGRPLSVLKELFAPVVENMALIGHNGAAAEYRGKLLHFGGYRKGQTERVLETCRTIEHVHFLADCLEGVFLLDDHPGFQEVCSRFFTNSRIVSPQTLLKMQPQVCKIALWDDLDAERNSWPRIGALTDAFDLMLSGEGWIDVMQKGEGKGSCLTKLQKALGVTPQQTMCFGDYMNDSSMMRCCDYSFAMKNAHPELKRLCRFQTEKTNEEDGVVDTICKMLSISLE